MKTQHTPGPWTVDNQYIHGPDGIRFLAVAGDGAGQANARLIASSPELLAELERTEASLTAILCSRVIDSTTSTWLELRRNRDTIRAAIARATGGDE